MHVLLEGVIPYTIKYTLQKFIISKKYFTLPFLNGQIACFHYSRSDSRNKPAQLKSDMLDINGNLKQTGDQITWLASYLMYVAIHVVCFSIVITFTFSHLLSCFIASQMWNLAIHLPLMVGSKIPENNQEWECYLVLLNILKICMSRILSPDLIEYLEFLTRIYLTSFHECYPSANIIPKQHYMIHFPSQIKK